jgi:predicted dehydrogenase
MKKTIDRRQFLKTSTVAVMGLSLPIISKGNNLSSDSNSINLGIIGTGDRGAWESYILSKTPGIDVIACCDIIPKHLQDGLEEAVKGAKGYKDYQKLLADDNIDAVLIATPQHLHYQMVLDAM